MKKTIVALIIVAVIAIVIAYRKPIGKFMAGEKSDKKTIDAETKMKAAMIVAAEQATDKAKKAIDAVEKKAQELDAEKAAEAAKGNADPAPEEDKKQEPENTEPSWLEGYDEESRIMKIGGKVYMIPSSDRLRSVQANLIEGFNYLVENAVLPSPYNPMIDTAQRIKGVLPGETTAKYRQLVADMIEADTVNTPKTGIDGKLNRPTAEAFAECVKIMPGVVEQYIMNV